MQCQAYREQHGCDFISATPTNLYGPGDFDLESAHVLPGGSRLHWSRFTALLKRHPLPAARIVHCYTLPSKALP
jgi:hypothetical protein